MYTPTVAGVEKRLAELKDELVENMGTWAYLEKNILPVKEQFMTPWVGAVPNFGNFSSARAESGHSYIKKYIETSTQNLFQVCEKLMLAMDTQVHKVTSSLAAD